MKSPRRIEKIHRIKEMEREEALVDYLQAEKTAQSLKSNYEKEDKKKRNSFNLPGDDLRYLELADFFRKNIEINLSKILRHCEIAIQKSDEKRNRLLEKSREALSFKKLQERLQKQNNLEKKKREIRLADENTMMRRR